MVEGLSAEMMEKNNVTTEHYLDTVHLNQAVAYVISRARITPQIKTSIYKDRQQAINRLADSMAWRAEREVRMANEKCGNRRDLAIDSNHQMLRKQT